MFKTYNKKPEPNYYMNLRKYLDDFWLVFSHNFKAIVKKKIKFPKIYVTCIHLHLSGGGVCQLQFPLAFLNFSTIPIQFDPSSREDEKIT